MCFSNKPEQPLSNPEARSSFHATRLNSTTFRIVEQDAFGKNPFIYAKIYAHVLVVVDTGCNAPRDTTLSVTSLRKYLETFRVRENNNAPINPGGRLLYLIILSHCYYDHIGGVAEFRDKPATIYASKAMKYDIIDRGHLHQFSLHQDLGLPAPQLPPFLGYDDDDEDIKAIYWANENKIDLRLQIIATPGHSVDSIVVLDHDEKVAFRGDSAYEHGPLFYSYGSDIIQHRASIKKIQAIIQSVTPTNSGEKQWVAACGHLTSGVPALPLLQRVEKFMDNVLRKRVLPLPTSKDRMGRAGTQYFEDDGLAMSCPIEMIEEAIKVYRHE